MQRITFDIKQKTASLSSTANISRFLYPENVWTDLASTDINYTNDTS